MGPETLGLTRNRLRSSRLFSRAVSPPLSIHSTRGIEQSNTADNVQPVALFQNQPPPLDPGQPEPLDRIIGALHWLLATRNTDVYHRFTVDPADYTRIENGFHELKAIARILGTHLSFVGPFLKFHFYNTCMCFESNRLLLDFYLGILPRNWDSRDHEAELLFYRGYSTDYRWRQVLHL